MIYDRTGQGTSNLNMNGHRTTTGWSGPGWILGDLRNQKTSGSLGQVNEKMTWRLGQVNQKTSWRLGKVNQKTSWRLGQVNQKTSWRLGKVNQKMSWRLGQGSRDEQGPGD